MPEWLRVTTVESVVNCRIEPPRRRLSPDALSGGSEDFHDHDRHDVRNLTLQPDLEVRQPEACSDRCPQWLWTGVSLLPERAFLAMVGATGTGPPAPPSFIPPPDQPTGCDGPVLQPLSLRQLCSRLLMPTPARRSLFWWLRNPLKR